MKDVKDVDCRRMRSFTACTSWLLSGLALLMGASQMRADENLFGYTYTADVLPRGKWELEQWITDRIG